MAARRDALDDQILGVEVNHNSGSTASGFKTPKGDRSSLPTPLLLSRLGRSGRNPRQTLRLTRRKARITVRHQVDPMALDEMQPGFDSVHEDLIRDLALLSWWLSPIPADQFSTAGRGPPAAHFVALARLGTSTVLAILTAVLAGSNCWRSWSPSLA
jgi:hypothetical protein